MNALINTIPYSTCTNIYIFTTHYGWQLICVSRDNVIANCVHDLKPKATVHIHIQKFCELDTHKKPRTFIIVDVIFKIRITKMQTHTQI